MTSSYNQFGILLNKGNILRCTILHITCFAYDGMWMKSVESNQIEQDGRGLCLACLLSTCVGVGEDLGVHKKNIFWPQENKLASLEAMLVQK